MNTPRKQQGLSLVELLIAMGISLLLLSGLVTVFATSSQNQRELQKSAQQIENGRYAMDILTQDLHHAGYYGRYVPTTAGTSLPDPCITGDATALANALPFPVQAYIASGQTTYPDFSGTGCATYLPTANLKAGSDVVVIRRAETSPLAVGSTANDADVYVQANPAAIDLHFGTATVLTTTNRADGAAATVKKKDGTTAEEIRKYRVHIYFVAPCSIPSSGTTCTGASTEDTIPTLKRLELSATGGVRALTPVPLAEGIEALKVEFGIDNSPSGTNASTGLIGDGAPDVYVPSQTSTSPSVADFGNAVSAKIFLIARNTEKSAGFTDTKTYPVATPITSASGVNLNGTGLVYGPYNDNYKRHAYNSEVRLQNLSSRRENP